MNCLELNHVTKRFGGLIAIENLNLQIDERELRCIIGPNGAGKTTLFNLICGNLEPDDGFVAGVMGLHLEQHAKDHHETQHPEPGQLTLVSQRHERLDQEHGEPQANDDDF